MQLCYDIIAFIMTFSISARLLKTRW